MYRVYFKNFSITVQATSEANAINYIKEVHPNWINDLVRLRSFK